VARRNIGTIYTRVNKKTGVKTYVAQLEILEDPDWDRKFYIGVSRTVSQIYIFGDSAAISRAKTLAHKQM